MEFTTDYSTLKVASEILPNSRSYGRSRDYGRKWTAPDGTPYRVLLEMKKKGEPPVPIPEKEYQSLLMRAHGNEIKQSYNENFRVTLRPDTDLTPEYSI